MKIYNALVVVLFLSLGMLMHAQIRKNSLVLPEVSGYEVLKCDLHMHTVFSDGLVWPTVRVTEALAEGLDAISLTDHIEYRPHLKEFASSDHFRSYDIAEKLAGELGIILIKGTEITRRMPPGHFNAIFINDANVFEQYVDSTDTRNGENIAETLQQAVNQDAFVFWNHPWFQHPENKSEWQPIHEELYRKGLISGIEVINGDRYDPVIFQWCLDKNLTILSTSDIHAPMNLAHGDYRSMTLVFAKERSENAIKEALKERRTVAYSKHHLYGEERWVRPLFENSLEVKVRPVNNRLAYLEVVNKSGIPFTLEVVDAPDINVRLSSFGRLTLEAKSETLIPIQASQLEKGRNYTVKVNVENAHVSAGVPLEYVFSFKL
jgi:3',5'-nucleoside bisphosphate phosphatase